MSESNVAFAPVEELPRADSLEVRHTWLCRRTQDGETTSLSARADVSAGSDWWFELASEVNGEHWEASVRLTASEAKNLAWFIIASGRKPPDPGHDG